MDYLTTCEELTARLGELGAEDPVVPAALAFAIQPWLKGIHDGSDMMRWGLFGGAVQVVADRLWPGPATVSVAASSSPIPGPRLDSAVAGLVSAVANVLGHAGQQGSDARAWEYAAAFAELLDAVKELE